MFNLFPKLKALKEMKIIKDFERVLGGFATPKC